jgi:hypothetical protein
MKSLLYFFAFVMLVSCADNENAPALAGEYTGTFYRTRDNVKVLESAITLKFDNGEFSGGGADHQAPAVCHGKYSQDGNAINFNNECFFTANFDWTLILSEKFVITETSETILLSKEIDSQNGDYYVLSKTLNPR